MTVISKINIVDAQPVFEGRGKSARATAFMRIAPLAMVEQLSRAETISNLVAVLGTSPDAALMQACRNEYIVGFVATSLPGTDNAKRLEAARMVVLTHAANAAKSLKKSHTGRRTPEQERAYGNARQRWSSLLAETPYGTAKTEAEKNKAKRGTKARGATLGKTAKPELGKVTHTTREEVTGYVEQMSATLLSYSNRHAKLLPVDYGMAIQAFKTAINKAANAMAERKAKAEAIKSDGAK